MRGGNGARQLEAVFVRSEYKSRIIKSLSEACFFELFSKLIQFLFLVRSEVAGISVASISCNTRDEGKVGAGTDPGPASGFV